MSISDLNLAIKPQDKSLFIVKTQKILQLWDENIYGEFKVRVSFIDQAGTVHDRIPVTDLLTLAFVNYQISKNNYFYSTELMRAFNNNPYRYIRIGLTREYHGQYWKQVTAIITIPDLFNGNSYSHYEKQIGVQV